MIPIRASIRGTSPPLVTLALIAVNLLGFLWELSLPEPALDDALMRWGLIPLRQMLALAEAPLALDAWLVPVFTSMFLHGGWAHVIGNMLFLWVFGDAVEARLGRGRFAMLYFAAGIIAGQSQVLVDPYAAAPMIGASGAVAGVLGAYLITYPRSWVTVVIPIVFIPLFFELPALLFLGLWFLEQFFMGALALSARAAQATVGVAWWAHIGGFVVGAVMVKTIAPSRRLEQSPTRRRVYYVMR